MMIRAKRRFPRVPINRPALVRLVEPDPYLKPFEDFTRAQTLGAGGCMFVSPETLGFGSLAVLLISLGHKVVRADTKVVYEKPRQDGSLEAYLRRLRVQREALHAQLREPVRELVDQLEGLDDPSRSELERLRQALDDLGPEAGPILVLYIDPGDEGKDGATAATKGRVLRAREVTNALVRLRAPGIVEDLIRRTSTGSTTGRVHAVEILGTSPEPERAGAWLEELFRTSEGELRLEAVRALARLGGTEGPTLRAALTDSDTEVVATVLAAVDSGQVDLGVVPLEDSHDGLSVATVDGLAFDTSDVVVASTGVSLFAYVADGASGLHVLQLTSPETVPGYLGFSPRPEPVWIAGYRTHGPAVALSRGLERDRAVDETGHQVSIFNRLGAGPLTRRQMERLYLRDGALYTVRDSAAEAAPDANGAGVERSDAADPGTETVQAPAPRPGRQP